MGLGRNPTKYKGVRAKTPPNMDVKKVAPTTSNVNFEIGDFWLDKVAGILYQFAGGTTWIQANNTFDSTDFTVTSGSVALNEGIPNYATVSITSAQVKALAATQITLVAAPGAGKMIQFESATFKLVYGGTNVFTESGDNLAIKYTDASGVAVSQAIETTGFIDQTVSTYTNAEPAINAIVAATAAENKALVLDNTGSEIAGNAGADNTLEVSVCYRIVAI